jgi:hypothetical protein
MRATAMRRRLRSATRDEPKFVRPKVADQPRIHARITGPLSIVCITSMPLRRVVVVLTTTPRDIIQQLRYNAALISFIEIATLKRRIMFGEFG